METCLNITENNCSHILIKMTDFHQNVLKISFHQQDLILNFLKHVSDSSWLASPESDFKTATSLGAVNDLLPRDRKLAI